MKRAIFAGIALAAIVMLIAHLEYRFAPMEQAMRDEPKVGFIYPIPCTATLSQRGAGEQFVTRCYFTPSDKGKQ